MAAVQQATIGELALRWGSRTHPGNVRQLNEDAVLAAPGFYVIADGMGGHEAGDVASSMAIDVFAEALREASPDGIAVERVSELIAAANRLIRARGRQDGRPGMGTTVVGVVVARNGDDHSLVAFNVGDSRCYRLANGVLQRITHDHSHVQELVDAGSLTDDEARVHPMRNVITRALGSDEIVSANYVLLDRATGRLLLCSDGLSGALTEPELSRHLGSSADAQTVADELVAAVVAGKATDNVSAIVIDVTVHERLVDDVTGPRVGSVEGVPR